MYAITGPANHGSLPNIVVAENIGNVKNSNCAWKHQRNVEHACAGECMDALYICLMVMDGQVEIGLYMMLDWFGDGQLPLRRLGYL
jgi:hypothetical protein